MSNSKLLRGHAAQHKELSAPGLLSAELQCVDYSNQPLPSGYDLIFSRDSLQHIPMHGAWQFLNNVKASGAKYLLVGSYIKNSEPNFNIAKAGKGCSQQKETQHRARLK